MTNTLDYAPSLFAFALAILGVLGHSKDASKDGVKAITRIGWVVISLSFVLLLVGSISVHERHVTQQSERLIANNMRPRLANGVELIVKPLCGNHREFVHETLTADIRAATTPAGYCLKMRGREAPGGPGIHGLRPPATLRLDQLIVGGVPCFITSSEGDWPLDRLFDQMRLHGIARGAV